MTIQCVFASLNGSAIDLQKMSILAKKIIFSHEAHFDLGGSVKQAKLSHLGHRKPAHIHRKADASKTSNYLMRIQRHNTGPFFFKNEQGEAVTVNDDSYRGMLNDFLFTKIEEEDIGSIWFRDTQPKLHSMFCDLFLKVELSAAELISLGHLGFDCVELLFVGCRQR